VNGAIQNASPFLDEPWRRFAWIAPLSAAIWLAILLGFGIALEKTSAPPPELAPVEARIIEIPPTVGGLQGGPAAPHLPAPAALSPKPHVEAPRKLAAVHPPRPVHPHKRKLIPAAPPSISGTRKEIPAPAPPTSAGKAAPAAPGTSASGPAQRSAGAGNGPGLGTDSLGARAIYSPVPQIPDDLRDEAFEAVAIAHFEVSYDGKVKVTLTRPTPDPRVNQILLNTLQQWRFFPAMRGGVTIDSAFDLRIPVSVQ
jgi:protein TonB